MKPRTLLIVFGLFVAVVSFYVVLEKVYLPRHEKEKEKEGNVFTFEREALDTIKITTERSNIILVREKDKDRWMMTAPLKTETDAGEVESFIASALDAQTGRSLGTKTELKDSMGDFGLKEPEATVILGSGDDSQALFLGASTPSGEEVYAMRKGDDRVFLVDRSVLDDLTKDETTLRDKTLVAFVPDDIEEFSVVRDNKTVTVKKDASGSWMITEPIEYKADPDQIGDILDFVADEGARGFAEENADKKKLGLDSPAITLVLVDKDGATSRLMIGGPAGEGTYWAMREGRPWIFTVSEEVKNKLTVSADFIMDKTLLAYTVADVTAFTVTTADGSVSVARDGDAWKITKPQSIKGDKNAINNLLLDIKEMRLEEIVEKPAGDLTKYGLDTPTLSFSVTYKADGVEHKAELKVKKGDGADSYGYLSTGDFIFTIPTETIAPIAPSLFALKNKALLTFAPDEVEKLTVIKGDVTYAFKRRTLGRDRWKMTEPESLGVDTESMKYLLTEIEDLSYSGVLADTKDLLKGYGLDRPEMTITITGKDDTEIGTIRLVRDEQGEGGRYMPAVSSSLDKIYRVDADPVDEIMSDIETIRKGR